MSKSFAYILALVLSVSASMNAFATCDRFSVLHAIHQVLNDDKLNVVYNNIGDDDEFSKDFGVVTGTVRKDLSKAINAICPGAGVTVADFEGSATVGQLVTKLNAK